MYRWLTLLCALAIVGATTVLAGSTAEVYSSAVVSIVNTSDALLSVAPGAGPANATGIAYLSGGVLILDFQKGADAAKTYGFQPGSTYLFRDLVTVTNRAERTVAVSTTMTDGADSPLADLVWVQDQNGNPLAGAEAGAVSLAPGEVMYLSFKWQGNSPSGSRTPVKMTLFAE